MWRVTLDSTIVTLALLAGAYEIAFGGSRAFALTLISAVLISPAVLRLDEARKHA